MVWFGGTGILELGWLYTQLDGRSPGSVETFSRSSDTFLLCFITFCNSFVKCTMLSPIVVLANRTTIAIFMSSVCRSVQIFIFGHVYRSFYLLTYSVTLCIVALN